MNFTTTIKGFQHAAILCVLMVMSSLAVAQPTITLTNSTTNVCEGITNANFAYSATTGTPVTYSIDWDVTANGQGFVDVTDAALTASPISTFVPAAPTPATYNGILTVKDGGATTSVGYPVSVTVYAKPAITLQPSSQAVCSGSNLSFSAAASSSVAITYQWQHFSGANVWLDIPNGSYNGGNYSGVNTSTLNITGATTAISGTMYRCLFSTGCATSTASNTATITVNEAPSITATSFSDTVCQGTAAAFFVNAKGTGLTYQWQRNIGTGWTNLSNGGSYSDVTTNLMTIANTPLSFNGNQYRCVVSGTCTPSPVTTSTATLHVANLPTITQHPANQNVCNGNNISFTSTSTSTVEAYYKWQHYSSAGVWLDIPNGAYNGGNYSGVNTKTLNVIGATPAINGTIYRCIHWTACTPPVPSNGGKITVLEQPSITASSTSKTVCEGQAEAFFVNAKGAGLTYQWQVNTGSGWTNLSNGGNYSNVTSKVMTISNTPANFTGNMYRCVVSGTCSPAATTPAATLTVNQLVAITTPPNTVDSFCSGGSISIPVVAVGAGLTYQWYIVNNGTPTALTNGGNYSGVTTNTLNISGITENNNSSSYYYYCKLTGTCNTVLTTQTTIKVQGKPTVTAGPANIAVCDNGTASFTTVAKGANLAYQWQVNSGSGWSNISNGGNYSGATTSMLTVSNAPLNFSGNLYRCVVSGSCTPTVASASAVLTVNQYVAITTAPKTLDSFCSGGSTTIPLTAVGAGLTYQWYIVNGTTATALTNTGAYSGVTTNTLNISGITESNNSTSYTYYCKLTGTCNSVQSAPTTIKVQGKPAITTNPSNATVCHNGTATFTTAAKGANLTYQWQVRPGSSGSWSNLANNSVYSGATTSALSVNATTTALNNYQYRCVVNGSCTPGVVTSVAVLTVNPNLSPTVSISTATNKICVGTTVTFTASVPNIGYIAPSYQWYVNNVQVGTNSSTFSTSSLANNDQVKCRITTSYACASSNTALSNGIAMEVKPYITPSITIKADSTSACSGDPVKFSSTINNGGSSPAYQWRVNGSNINGANSSTFTYSSLSNGANVTCVLTSNTMCPTPSANVLSNAVNMNIITKTNSSIAITANTDTSICDGKEVVIKTSIVNGGTTPSYQWVINGVAIPGQTADTYISKKIKNGEEIECRLTSSGTCVQPSMSNLIRFNVEPVRTPKVELNILYVGNNKHEFTATPIYGGNNPVYIWYKNGLAQQGITGNTYGVTNLKPTDVIYVKMISDLECVTTKSADSRSLTTSVANLSNETFKELGLYPNPNSGQFTITGELKTVSNNSDAQLRVTNALGQVVYQKTYSLNGSKINMDVNIDNRVANGTYSASIIVDGSVTNVRFVLNR